MRFSAARRARWIVRGGSGEKQGNNRAFFAVTPVIFRAAVAAIPLWAATSVCAQPAVIYKDPDAPIEARVDDLLARMTLEEKVMQMQSMWIGRTGILNADGSFAAGKAQQVLARGIGQIGRPSDFMGSQRFQKERFRSVAETVAFVNAVQRFLVEQTRLGIPALFHDETAHGYMALDATVFPSPTALGSTWDLELVEQVFAVAGREARLRGATVGLSPVVDLLRDPRWGRAEEFFGEDPYHVSRMGIASVRGQQGRVRPLGPDKVFATLKHFVHGTPLGGLNIGPADVSERTLREIYLVPFRDLIREADPAIVMPAYNEVGGVPAHANRALLQDTGRKLLGFKGAYYSDYRGITNLVTHHAMAANHDEAAILAIDAGIDAELPDGAAFSRLPELVRSGRVAEAAIDVAAARTLRLKFEAGLFERPYSDARRAVRETNTAADIQLARKAAQKSLVLLKNDGVLPLDPRTRMRLAVIGPNAVEPLFGGYSGENPKAVGILAGVKAAAGPNMTIEHADGVWITPPVAGDASHAPIAPVPEADNAVRIAAAVKVAERADVIVLAIGDNPTVTREALTITRPTGPLVLPGDRTSLGLYGDQDKLVDAMIATGKPIVALLLNGRPLATPRLAEKANALLEGWYLGQEGGNAFADVLFGKVSPGGKLPVSIPRSAGELPIYYNAHPSATVNAYIEGPRQPLFPFGHGLSYTSFELSEPRLARPQIGPGETAIVDVDVVNTGSRPADEVVQLYVRDDFSSVPRPVLELKGFRRVSLKPGERRTVRFELAPDALAFWNIDMQWVVEPGTFTISAGNSSVALKSTKLTVAGTG